MSDEESYECYGEGDMETSSPVDNVLTKFVQIFIMCLAVAISREGNIKKKFIFKYFDIKRKLKRMKSDK